MSLCQFLNFKKYNLFKNQVSRCCGLKITSEGYVVTLAKNNHHVLVLNTLYIAQKQSRDYIYNLDQKIYTFLKIFRGTFENRLEFILLGGLIFQYYNHCQLLILLIILALKFCKLYFYPQRSLFGHFRNSQIYWAFFGYILEYISGIYLRHIYGIYFANIS